MSLAKTGSPLAPERFVSSAHWMQSLSEWDMAAARTHAERAARHFAQLGEQAADALEAGDERAAEWRELFNSCVETNMWCCLENERLVVLLDGATEGDCVHCGRWHPSSIPVAPP